MACMLGLARHQETHKSPIPCRILAGLFLNTHVILQGVSEGTVPVPTRVFFSNSYVFDAFLSVGFARVSVSTGRSHYSRIEPILLDETADFCDFVVILVKFFFGNQPLPQGPVCVS